MRKNISLSDRGKYYRGLLVLIRRDRIIGSAEKETMIGLGQSLDFDRRFCEAAIRDVLENEHIKDEPMKFSNQETSKLFVRDALMLACIDGEMHPEELTWLKAVAAKNELADEWLSGEMKALRQRAHSDPSSSQKAKEAAVEKSKHVETPTA